MQIIIANSELREFIDEQVKAGHYPSPEALVEAAITDLRDNSSEELDDETIAALQEAEAELDRGEGIDLDAVRAQLARHISGR